MSSDLRVCSLVVGIFVRFKHFLSVLLVVLSINVAPATDIDTVIDEALRQQSTPGVSAVVIRDHQVIYSAGRGVADIKTGRPMTDETAMYVGSLSKILTAMLTLIQVERGALALTDTLDRQPPITVLQLITHQSGLPREGDFGYWFSGSFPDAPTLADYLARASLHFDPGSRTR